MPPRGDGDVAFAAADAGTCPLGRSASSSLAIAALSPAAAATTVAVTERQRPRPQRPGRRRALAIATSVAVAPVAAMLLVAVRGCRCSGGSSNWAGEAAVLISSDSGRETSAITQPLGNTASPGGPEEQEVAAAFPPRAPADYVIDNAWLHTSSARAWELKPPSEAEAESSPGYNGVGPVRRLLMPRRLEDMYFLMLLKPENLRVDLWPHRNPEPHVHVRIFTDAIAFYPPPANPKRWLLAKWFAPRRQWLLLFQAVVHVPRGVALLACSTEWRWAEFNTTEEALRQVTGGAFRVLEVSCPTRQRSFLAPPLSRHTEGPRAPKDVLLGCFRFAFLVILVAACVAQIVLLLICIVMLLVQVRRGGRPGPHL
mmetsp:Transcript_131753/g.332776  ORF Transcript_131753/g.332776 Transcript_131753/m.332776 type:complete len:370 (+) Transcript_131753:110-1219(+)